MIKQVLRSNQGYTLDGKPFGFSGVVYKSAERRDAYVPNMGPSASTSWLGRTSSLRNERGHNFGHVVNACTTLPNLAYVEFDLVRSFDL